VEVNRVSLFTLHHSNSQSCLIVPNRASFY
jgi:hypothetical protein